MGGIITDIGLMTMVACLWIRIGNLEKDLENKK